MGKKIEISGVGVRVDFYYGSVLESPRGFLRVEYSSAVPLSRDPRLIGVAYRAILRSKIDPRSRLNHRRKALFIFATPYEPALGGGECKAVNFVDFDGSSISPSKTTPLEVEPKKHS